jgi:hypothetical protein
VIFQIKQDALIGICGAVQIDRGHSVFTCAIPINAALEETPPAGIFVGFMDTVEVCGSSPHGPTIFFSDLASTTFLDQAPIGSIKEEVRDSQGSSRLLARTVEKDAPA